MTTSLHISAPAPDTAALLPGRHVQLAGDRPMPLDSGAMIGPFTIAYQTYGRLNAERSNAVLVCHALTGDQFIAEPHPITGKPGWWSQIGRSSCRARVWQYV